MTAHRATEVVAAAVEAGDLATALKVLKGIGALSGDGVTISSEDPEVLRDEAQIAQATAQKERSLQRFMNSFG